LDTSGRVVQTFERTAVSVVVGEPEPGLFQWPADYREIPPSQANRELVEARTGKPFGSTAGDGRLNPGMEAMDKKYFDSQAHKPK
jgi:hypothetical protein